MAKRDQILRLMNIVSCLRANNNGASFRDILLFLEEKNYLEGENELAFSEKTFQRDRKLLNELFGIEIQFNRSALLYQISNAIDNPFGEAIFDNFILVNAYKQAANHQDIIYFEKRQAKGLELLEEIIYSIKNSKIISFEYLKHLEGNLQKKVIEPYAVKEFRNRWYVLAREKEGSGENLKIFGLDRISNLEVTHAVFSKKSIDMQALFENSFGIVATAQQIPTVISLTFNASQSNFVKSLPIHHSQHIVTDTEKEFKVELTLVPTYDFYQELATHAERIIAIQPQFVKDAYLHFLQKGIDQLK